MTGTTVQPDALFQSVGDVNRLRLIRLLACEELNVREMVSILGISQPGVSKHLAVLREAGWLHQRREGTRNWYALAAGQEFAAGPDLHAAVLAQTARLAEAARDDDALVRVMAARDASGVDFADIAEQWDRIRQSFEHVDIQAGAVGALVEPGLEVLDVGTGTGALLPLLAGAGSRVIAVDRSPEMLDRARAACRRAGLKGVRFRKADIRDLPFADGRFDAAYGSMVLHHLSDPAEAMAELARVVRPGGRLALIAFTRHDQVWMRRELAHAHLGFDRVEIETLFRRVGVEPTGWLVRGRRDDRIDPDASDPTGSRGLQWPDVFLAVGRKRDATAAER